MKVYGDFTLEMRAPIVALNIGAYDSSEVSDALSQEYGIVTRAGAHCAPLMHEALGTRNREQFDSVFPALTQRRKWILPSGRWKN